MQPERIANRAYADRMGNGDEASGEGWLYRGRGLIQLTGKDAYAAFSLAANNEALLNLIWLQSRTSCIVSLLVLGGQRAKCACRSKGHCWHDSPCKRRNKWT